MPNERPKFNREELGRSIQIESASAHVDEVLAIANEAKIDPRNPGTEDTKSGFLIYPLTREGYQKRTRGNDFFITFSEQGQVKGFVMCYDRAFLNKLIEEGEIGHEDGIVNYLSSQTPPEDNFLFGDQIGISRQNRTREAGTMLLEEVFVKMREKGMKNMYVAVLHQPVRNEASINFIGGLGFNNVAKVTNSDGLVWGIYHVELS